MRISGCTVHFVIPEVDAGGIIAQESVPVLVGDTEETLQERIKVSGQDVCGRASNFLLTLFLSFRSFVPNRLPSIASTPRPSALSQQARCPWATVARLSGSSA